MKNVNKSKRKKTYALPAGRAKTAVMLLSLLLACAHVHAQTVTSLSALQTAINNASPGAVITLANGVYTASVDITINKQGTSSQPITIQAQTTGGAEIKGTGGFDIVSPAKYIVIKGFKFTHSASHASMESGTSFCRWTRNLFDTPGAGEYLQLNGNDHEIDYNTFQNKEDPGKFITVRGTGSQIAQRLWIHHNYFYNQDPQTGNGNETFQFGLSGYSLSNSNSIVEYNLFELCEGENEMISVKASEVTLRYNTIRDCPAQFTLRHGNRCLVYGNYFINTPGLRIFGDDHKIYSNHYENCNPAINIGNGDGEVADGAPLTSHDRPDRVLIAFNTLVNNPANITQSGRTDGLGATNITVANNIIQGGGPAASIAGPYTGGVWSNNMLFNTNGDGDMPASGYTTANPLLARDATGTFHLQPGSPAINAAAGSYPSVTTDMDGQARTSPLDIGADEVSSAAVTAQILAPSMVGQNGNPPPPACPPVIASADDGNVAANVLDNDLNTRWSANGDGQWIQFCLGTATTVSAVQIAFYNGNVRTSTFDIQVGNNGTAWTTVAANRVSSGTTLNLETFSFTPASAKYVRIVGHGNSVNLWNSYTEVKILAAAQTYNLTPVHDAYVRDGVNASTTFGTTDPTVLVTKLNPTATTGNNRHTYLRFDLSGVSGTVSSAVLKLYGKIDDNRASNVPISAFAVSNTTWTESTITWNNKPATGASLETTTVTDSIARFYTWDITDYVQAELAAGRTQISMALISGIGTDPRITWNSKETGSNPPQLIVNASTPTSKAPVLETNSEDAVSKMTLNSYPNPFREASHLSISFSLKDAGKTNLSVYDVTGRLIAVLVNAKLSSGNYKVQLLQQSLPPGVYVLKLVQDGKVITKKLLKE
jgi:poly(beta-D-mannuronate) lyase